MAEKTDLVYWRFLKFKSEINRIVQNAIFVLPIVDSTHDLLTDDLFPRQKQFY